MRVVVMSSLAREGKSSIAQLLAGIYSVTQGDTSTVLEADGSNSLFDYCRNYIKTDITSSTAVLKALTETAGTRDNDILVYGNRVGKVPQYMYRLIPEDKLNPEYDNVVTSIFSKSCFKWALTEVPDVESVRSKKILNMADAFLYIFTQDPASLTKVKEFVKNNPDIAIKTCFVCNKYDDRICTNKKIEELTGVSWKNMMLIPNNHYIGKFSMDGRLVDVVNYIVVGHEDVIYLRKPLVDIMRFYFDDKTHKLIRGPETWNK